MSSSALPPVVISGSGLWAPEAIITNEEPVAAYNASAGSLIAFHLYHQDLEPGDIGVIFSFGAGYSIGSLVVRKR